MAEQDINPFASPLTEGEAVDPSVRLTGGGEPASRASRLGAQMIDGFLLLIVFVPLFMLFAGLIYPAEFGLEVLLDPDAPVDAAQSSGLFLEILSAVGAMACYLAINGYLIAKSGQTVGKKLLGIRVVGPEGTPPTFATYVGIRLMPFWIAGMLPGIGNFIGLVDALLIFRSSRRCLHDQIANTDVVKVA